VANPDSVIGEYGTDALRLYLMFLGPLEAMKPWNPRGIEGCSVSSTRCGASMSVRMRPPSQDLRSGDGHARDRATAPRDDPQSGGRHRGTALQHRHFSDDDLRKRVAEGTGREPRTALAFLQLLAPFAPHLAEELWARHGEPPSISRAPWPVYDPARLVLEQAKLVFQVNGKVRGDQLVRVGLPQSDAVEFARAHPRLKPYLEGKSVKKSFMCRVGSLIL